MYKGLIVFFSIFLFAYINFDCKSCQNDRPQFKPIRVFSFNSSKFEIKDIIDSIVEGDSSFSFIPLSDYIDTFIFERSFCIKTLVGPDSIKYYYYFSGDVKEWISNTDSSLLVLSYVAINGRTYDAKASKRERKKEIDRLTDTFKRRIVRPLRESIKLRPKYQISLLDSPGVGKIGVICKEKRVCDTLILRYLDGGKYTGDTYKNKKVR